MSIALQQALPGEANRKPYVMVQAYGRANTQNALYYVMDEDDKNVLLGNEQCCFGDKVYVIKEGTSYILGNDNTWYSSAGFLI